MQTMDTQKRPMRVIFSLVRSESSADLMRFFRSIAEVEFRDGTYTVAAYQNRLGIVICGYSSREYEETVLCAQVANINQMDTVVLKQEWERYSMALDKTCLLRPQVIAAS